MHMEKILESNAKREQGDKSEAERIKKLTASLHNFLDPEKYYDEPREFLAREERDKLSASGDPHDKKQLDRYEKSKFRGNYFALLFLILDMALRKDGLPVKNKEELSKETEEFLEEFRQLKTWEGNPIPVEMVTRSNALVQKVLDSIESNK